MIEIFFTLHSGVEGRSDSLSIFNHKKKYIIVYRSNAKREPMNLRFGNRFRILLSTSFTETKRIILLFFCFAKRAAQRENQRARVSATDSAFFSPYHSPKQKEIYYCFFASLKEQRKERTKETEFRQPIPHSSLRNALLDSTFSYTFGH